MNKYNIQVGDYIETTDGDVGYVTKVSDDSFHAKFISNKNPFKVFCNYEMLILFSGLEDSCTLIKQIGANKFYKKEKANLIPITSFVDIGRPLSVCNKLNELIDHVNTIQEILTKENE